jgi:hypothetical protein
MKVKSLILGKIFQSCSSRHEFIKDAWEMFKYNINRKITNNPATTFWILPNARYII